LIASLLISLREGLEASLIVGIVFGYLRKTGQASYRRYAWAGVLSAIVVSVAVAVGIQLIGAELEGRAEELFEGAMMLFAVLVLTWMIFWMRSQARTLKGALESELETAVRQTSPRGLFAVTFFAVAREGIETALLLAATAFVTNGMNTVIGTMLGLSLAVLIGVLLYASTIRLNMRLFFSVTSVLLLMFAAGLFMTSIHEFQEAGVLPVIQEHVWSITHILDENSSVGNVLKALFGYDSSPSFLQVLAYVGYWAFALVVMPWFVERSVTGVSNPQFQDAKLVS
jgi:high-affinity iron transporter